MRKILAAILAILPLIGAAQKTSTQISDVTVYKHGAIVSRSGKVSLKKGINEISLEGLSINLDPKSIRLGVKNSDVTIVSLLHETDVTNSGRTKTLLEKNAKRKSVISDSLAILKSEIEVLANTKQMILENKKIGGDQGVTSEQLAKMSQFYQSELTSLENKLRIKNKLMYDYWKEQKSISQSESNMLDTAQKQVSRINLKLQAPRDISSVEISLSYLIFDAQWSPFYEVRVSDADKPMQLVYKARVSQKSSENWDNVKLTLSTGDPSIENQKPEFEPMYLPPQRRQHIDKQWDRPENNLTYGTVFDDDGEPIAGANIIEEGTMNGAITDLDGNFKLEMEDTRNKIIISFVGYMSKVLVPGRKMRIYLEENPHELKEVVVVGYGTTKKADMMGSVAQIEPEERTTQSYGHQRKPKRETNIPLEIASTLSVNEFKIQIPYTIPCDGKDCNVSMITYTMPAAYKYSSAPRFNKEVFLVAEVPDLYMYSLLDGDATVYYQNVYQGETGIYPSTASDTLKLSIGSDKMLSIDREEIQGKNSKSLMGGNCRVEKTFEITVRNNKDFAVDIELEDQYPIAKYSDIKVTLTDSGNANMDAHTGRLWWNLSLKPHETQKVKFTYEVKYPKSYGFSVE